MIAPFEHRWTIHDGQLESADLPDGIKAHAGNLAAADGVLLLTGDNGAACPRRRALDKGLQRRRNGARG